MKVRQPAVTIIPDISSSNAFFSRLTSCSIWQRDQPRYVDEAHVLELVDLGACDGCRSSDVLRCHSPMWCRDTSICFTRWSAFNCFARHQGYALRSCRNT